MSGVNQRFKRFMMALRPRMLGRDQVYGKM